MSSHASSHNQTDAAQALTIERKKTKVLKQALKQERKDAAALKQEHEKTKAQVVTLNTQLQDKEKRYFDLYQEKMMLEETIIRESATNKLQTRGSVKGIGPPVTFANVVTPKADAMGIGFAGAGG